MYKCDECDKTFSSPKITNDYDGFDYGAQREVQVCPYCGCDSFSEYVGSCDGCGTDIYDYERYYKTRNFRYYCECCIDEIC